MRPDETTAPELPTDTVAMARALIGMTLLRFDGPEPLAVRIVETEAYPPGDPASHAFRGRTRRNGAMFARPGSAYVYLGYGSSWLLNVASECEGVGAAVLLRAAEPVCGEAVMARRRTKTLRRADLTNGPGKLCAALDVDRGLDGVNLCADPRLRLSAALRPPGPIGVSARIGITRAADAPLRFFERDNAFVSGPRWLNAGTGRPARRGE